MHSTVTGLSRQDTLPSEDPSWSYSRVPGQPAPIPPRNEPILYIPNDAVDSSSNTRQWHADLRLEDHLPSPHANSESMNGTVILMTASHITNTIESDHYLGKVCIGVSNSHILILISQIKRTKPQASFGLDDELSAMAALTIHASSGIYFEYSDSKALMIIFRCCR